MESVKFMKKIMKTILKVLGIILAIAVVLSVVVYFTVLQYPNLKEDPKVGKWYRLSTSEMKSSEGKEYHALFKKGSENNVLVYFAGGGVSVDEKTARNDTYNTVLVWPDMLANTTMNMGGLATNIDGNPLKGWTVIMFPYATGDFHCGTGEFRYTDKDGKEKILYHNGYINFTEAMDLVMEKAGVSDPENVIVTGYSAGGWGASILAEDVFAKYFPKAKNKTVLVDSSVALFDDWKDTAINVWKTPQHITDRINSNNITLDVLTALHNDIPEANILFDCSTRDGSLAQVQRYFSTKEIDETTGEMPVNEDDGDAFQKTLKEFVLKLKEQADAHVYIFDGKPWYEEGNNLTSHTIISVPYVFERQNDFDKSVCEWLIDAQNGTYADYGIELLDKTYEKIAD